MLEEQLRKLFEVAMAISASAFGLVFVGGGLFGVREIFRRNPDAGAWALLPSLFSLIGLTIIVSVWRGVFSKKTTSPNSSPPTTEPTEPELSDEEEARREETVRRFSQGFLVVFIGFALLFAHLANTVGVLAAIVHAARGASEFPEPKEIIPALLPIAFIGFAILGLMGMRRAAREPEARPTFATLGNHPQVEPTTHEVHAIRKARFFSPVQRLMPGGQWVLHREPAGGAVTLRIISYAKGGAIALGIFAAFWNGFVAFAFADIWRGGGIFAIFVSLFLLPFVLVGAVLIVTTLRLALSHGNPTPIVTLNSDVVRPGGTVELRWRFGGNLERYRETRILLQAREETVRGQGEDETRSSNIIHQQPFGPFLQSQGSVVIPIPTNATPSFETKSRQVVWELVVQAIIAGRPDVSEAFRFWVRQ